MINKTIEQAGDEVARLLESYKGDIQDCLKKGNGKLTITFNIKVKRQDENQHDLTVLMSLVTGRIKEKFSFEIDEKQDKLPFSKKVEEKKGKPKKKKTKA